MSSSPILYLSYDRVPAPKGAAVHIAHFVSALANAFGTIELVTVASAADPGPPVADFSSVKHTPIPVAGKDMIQRVLGFRRTLLEWWGDRHPQVVHFRSIYEGYPIACRKERFCDQLVFEVNGLPSIELKYHYPQVADDRELLHKLVQQEDVCLRAADLIITVSDVTRGLLVRRGVPPDRIRVIPNGVDPNRFPFAAPRPATGSEFRVLYAGTLAPWQGVRTAIEAVALYQRDFPVRLLIAGEFRKRQLQPVQDWAAKQGVANVVEFLGAVSQPELLALHHSCDCVLAPLPSNDRNVVQGCCPLKVLEAMSSGTPLIATNLPVVRALARDGWDALLVRPGSAKAIKDAMLRLRRDSGSARMRAASARRRIKQQFTWRHAQQALVDSYQSRLGVRPASSSASASVSADG